MIMRIFSGVCDQIKRSVRYTQKIELVVTSLRADSTDFFSERFSSTVLKGISRVCTQASSHQYFLAVLFKTRQPQRSYTC